MKSPCRWAKRFVMSPLVRDREAGYNQERSVWLFWPNAADLRLRTGTSEILSTDGNPNRVADSYFLPRCRSLVDNQFGLNCRTVMCRQQSNVQVSGMKLLFGVFIGQSFERWHFGLSWSKSALTLESRLSARSAIASKRTASNDIHNQQRHKNFDKWFLCLVR